MAKSNLDAQIRDRIEAFVDEVADLVRRAALDSVKEALEGPGSSPRPRGPRRKKGGARKKAGSARRGRRSSADVGAMGDTVASYVRANPGQTVTEIGVALGLGSKELRLPLTKLIEEKRLRTTGQRRGTRYHPAGRGGARKKAGAPRRKKAGRKKRTAKKTTRKRAAK